jgi:glutamate/aspartate transport system permease protein
MALDFLVFCKSTTESAVVAGCWGKDGDITYLQWMFHAWGWTL